MNTQFRSLLRDDDPAAVADFIRNTPGQLDTDDIKAALATAFEQIAEVRSLIRHVQSVR